MISFAPRFVESKIISPTPISSRRIGFAFTFGSRACAVLAKSNYRKVSGRSNRNAHRSPRRADRRLAFEAGHSRRITNRFRSPLPAVALARFSISASGSTKDSHFRDCFAPPPAHSACSELSGRDKDSHTLIVGRLVDANKRRSQKKRP